MKIRFIYFFLLFLGAFWLPIAFLQASPVAMGMPNRDLSSSSFVFVENKGQITDQYGKARQDIDFKLSGSGMSVFLGAGHLHYQWYKPLSSGTSKRSSMPGEKLRAEVLQWETHRVDLSLLGANTKAILIPEDKVSYSERIFSPLSPEQGWLASGYRKAIYKDIYPHIDWVIYVREQGIEYDFIVHPGGKVSDIRMSYGGAENLSLDQQGSLLVKAPWGYIKEHAPYTYQADGKAVASRFVLQGNDLGFATHSYEGMLTIDPKVQWATYVGGDFLFDELMDVYADGKGSVYAIGQTTTATNIATTGAFQTTLQGLVDALIMKFNEKGVIQWATYYGGSGMDRGFKITGDTLDNIYFALTTGAVTGLATTGSHQMTLGGDEDAIIAKFTAAGQRLWATYYGGNGGDSPNGLFTDGAYVYVSGQTTSTNQIATAGSFQAARKGGGFLDLFLAKFSESGQLEWGTYFGSEENDHGGQITMDKEGSIYLGGFTNGGSGLGTPGSYQPGLYNNSTNQYDVFLVKWDSAGRRIWSTYYGGEDEEWFGSVVCDDAGNVYMSGHTKSTKGIATSGSYQTAHGNAPGIDNFVVKFNPAGQRQWGSYYGGNGDEQYAYVSIMGGNKLLLSGTTGSTTGIATTDALQPAFAGGTESGDLYLARFDLDGNREWSTYYGGPGDEWGYRAYVGGANLYMTANTNSSSGVATPGSYQDTYKNPMLYSGLLAKFCFAYAPPVGFIQGVDSICAGNQQVYKVPEMDEAEGYIWTLPDGWLGNSDSSSLVLTTNEASGILQVQVIRCGDTSEVSVMPVYVYPSDAPVITVDEFVLGTVAVYIGYQWCQDGIPIPGADKATYRVTENGDYTVITLNAYGCTDTSAIYKVNNVGINSLKNNPLVHIYPNPASHYILIDAPLPVDVLISSVEGKVLLHSKTTQKVDVSGLATGIYLITLKDQQGNPLYTTKWLKF